MSSDRMNTDMKLLAGATMYVGDIPIKPMKLGEIAELGYVEFQHHIHLLLLTIDDMIESIDDFEIQAMLKAEKHKYKTFDLYMVSDGLSELMVDGLKMLFRTDSVEVDEDLDDATILIDGKYLINRDNFDEVVRVVEMQNNPSVSKEEEEDEYNPADETANRIAQKLKKSKQMIQDSKVVDGGGEGVTIIDIISAVTAMSNSINKMNVWGYTPYQLYEEFARLNKIDNYNLQIQASMWSPDVDIEHWSEPL